MTLQLSEDIRIEAINKARDLKTVKALWYPNRQTLGFFPDGAFEDAANRGTVLVALDNQDQCLGYLLYRHSHDKVVSITHLCVSEACRGKGVARRLAERLIELARDARGISLRCRRDFPANKLWPKLGFSQRSEIPGRGRNAKTLVCWWRTQQEATLFSEAAARLAESKIAAVIDANVLFDLSEPESPKTIPSKALLADWLRDILELFVTEEIFNEIGRKDDPNVRRKSQALAKKFYTLPCDSDRFDVLCSELHSLFPAAMDEQDESDLRQIARAIAGQAAYFVTHDDPLLEIAEDVETRYGLTILRPTNLIVRIDELRRSSEYEPARFAGSKLHIRALSVKDEDALAATFCNSQHAEKQTTFRQRLRCYLASPHEYKCTVLHDQQDQPLALLATRPFPGRRDQLGVALLRVQRGHLASTLARQMVRQCLLEGCKLGLELALVEDEHLQDETASALYDFGFFQTSQGWLKISLPIIDKACQIAERLAAFCSHPAVQADQLQQWADLLRNPELLTNTQMASEQEHLLWPAKIEDAALTTYIVPIKPHWAKELFDEALAGQDLFGRKQELALNTERVYYRSARGGILAPGRVLWYVSSAKGMSGTNCLRACSRLEEVEVGPPKELFRKYRRLGIYEWRQVYETAHQNVDQNIMVLRFSDTESFAKPIHWKQLRCLLAEEGINSYLQSPIRINNQLFLKIYRLAAR